ncbi:hypothetical protein MesoLj113c_15770 [Mesorhizobium sp. 113-3-9]|nr:hypothetical protein MesoLj113c_15770 [Mesorhizobium sp. 113-3-9]
MHSQFGSPGLSASGVARTNGASGTKARHHGGSDGLLFVSSIEGTPELPKNFPERNRFQQARALTAVGRRCRSWRRWRRCCWLCRSLNLGRFNLYVDVLPVASMDIDNAREEQQDNNCDDCENNGDGSAAAPPSLQQLGRPP